jgi:hypothetical protein
VVYTLAADKNRKRCCVQIPLSAAVTAEGKDDGILCKNLENAPGRLGLWGKVKIYKDHVVRNCSEGKEVLSLA